MYGIIIDTPDENKESYILHIITYQVMRMSQYQQYKTNQLMPIITMANVTMK